MTIVPTFPTFQQSSSLKLLNLFLAACYFSNIYIIYFIASTEFLLGIRKICFYDFIWTCSILNLILLGISLLWNHQFFYQLYRWNDTALLIQLILLKIHWISFLNLISELLKSGKFQSKIIIHVKSLATCWHVIFGAKQIIDKIFQASTKIFLITVHKLILFDFIFWFMCN